MNYLLESLGCFNYRIKSSARRDNLTSFFYICISFITFCWIIALAKLSSTILNRNSNNRSFCLIPEFTGNVFRFSSSSIMLSVSITYSCYYVGISPLYSQCHKRFNYGGELDFCQRSFLNPLRWLHGYCPFFSLYALLHLSLCKLWFILTLLEWMQLDHISSWVFYVSLILVCKYFI
jgi:hypothetical protein